MGALQAQSRASEQHAANLLSIGQVLTRLTPEFPDLTPSKLRFLEDQGLVHPARTESGYRKFSSSDLDRLRLILTMQRDHYFPLKVIRQALEDIDAGRSPNLSMAPATGPVAIQPDTRKLRREELLRETGAAPSLLDDAISTGLIAPAQSYGPEAVNMIRSLVELRRTGIEPRHLRNLRLAAEREADLIVSAISPLVRSATERPAARERATEVAAHLDRVRASIVRAGLNRI